MGKAGFVAALVVTALATACKSSRTTPAMLHPLFNGAEAVRVPEAVGLWIEEADESDDPDPLEFRSTPDGQTTLILSAGNGRSSAFEVLFGRLGEDLYWDLTATPAADEGEFYAEHRLSLHSVARIRVQGDRLEIALLGTAWLKEAVEAGTLDLAHQVVDDDVLLTATTAELQRFLLDHAGEPGLFGDPTVFRRAPEGR